MSVEGWPVQWTAERAIVTFPAEVDANNAHIGRSRLMAVIEQDGAKVVIADMTRTTFCDSAGVTALAAARRMAVAHGAAFSLACSSPQILRILELTGLDQILPLFATVDEALALGHLPCKVLEVCRSLAVFGRAVRQQGMAARQPRLVAGFRGMREGVTTESFRVPGGELPRHG